MSAKCTEKVTAVFWLFLSGATLGWLYEVVLHLFQSHRFVNRGMLHGPWLPIYGIGCLLMVVLKCWIGNKPVCYFAVCTLSSAVLEYVTSWGLEAIYHTRWWDYSDLPMNLNGRIFLGGLIGFGLAGCGFVYLLLPAMKNWYQRVSLRTWQSLAVLLADLFLADVLISLISPNAGFGITRP